MAGESDRKWLCSIGGARLLNSRDDLLEIYRASHHCTRSKLKQVLSRWPSASQVCEPLFLAPEKPPNRAAHVGPNGSDYAAANISAEILSQATSDESAVSRCCAILSSQTSKSLLFVSSS